MKTYEFRHILDTGHGCELYYRHYNVEGDRFLAESDEAAIQHAEELQEALDKEFVEDYAARNDMTIEEVKHTMDYEYAPCLTGGLYRIDIDSDGEEVEIQI